MDSGEGLRKRPSECTGLFWTKEPKRRRHDVRDLTNGEKRN